MVTVVSKGMFDEFSDRANSICTIYNGFDEADFMGKHTTRPEKFIISYVGRSLRQSKRGMFMALHGRS